MSGKVMLQTDAFTFWRPARSPHPLRFDSSVPKITSSGVGRRRIPWDEDVPMQGGAFLSLAIGAFPKKDAGPPADSHRSFTSGPNHPNTVTVSMTGARAGRSKIFQKSFLAGFFRARATILKPRMDTKDHE